jgi:hypothetical protein
VAHGEPTCAQVLSTHDCPDLQATHVAPSVPQELFRPGLMQIPAELQQPLQSFGLHLPRLQEGIEAIRNPSATPSARAL